MPAGYGTCLKVSQGWRIPANQIAHVWIYVIRLLLVLTIAHVHEKYLWDINWPVGEQYRSVAGKKSFCSLLLVFVILKGKLYFVVFSDC